MGRRSPHLAVGLAATVALLLWGCLADPDLKSCGDFPPGTAGCGGAGGSETDAIRGGSGGLGDGALDAVADTAADGYEPSDGGSDAIADAASDVPDALADAAFDSAPGDAMRDGSAEPDAADAEPDTASDAAPGCPASDAGQPGEVCRVGVGACEAEGALVCDRVLSALVCGAEPGEPTPERCDGLDNDCDGVIDQPIAILRGNPEVLVGRQNVDHIIGRAHMAWTGEGYLIAWPNQPAGTQQRIFTAFVTADGAFMGGARALSDPLQRARDPRVATSGDTVGVVWAQQAQAGEPWGIYFAAFRRDGERNTAPLRLSQLAVESDSPAITAAAGGFAVVWIERRAARNDGILFSRVDARGQPQPGSRTRAITEIAGEVSATPGLATNGRHYALTFSTGARGGSLFVFDEDSPPRSVGFQAQPVAPVGATQVAWADDVVGVTWSQQVAGGDSQVHFQAFRGEDELPAPNPLRSLGFAETLGDQNVSYEYPVLSWDGQFFTVAYKGARALWVQRVITTPTRLSAPLTIDQRFVPDPAALVFSGSEYALVGGDQTVTFLHGPFGCDRP